MKNLKNLEKKMENLRKTFFKLYFYKNCKLRFIYFIYILKELKIIFSLFYINFMGIGFCKNSLNLNKEFETDKLINQNLYEINESYEQIYLIQFY